MKAASLSVHNKGINTRMLVSIAMLSAVSIVLSYIKITPPLSPSFAKMDISDFPALIAAFTFGPISGVTVELIKNAFGLLSTATGGVGELANFLIGASMALASGIIYQYNKTRQGAVLSLLAGSMFMAIVGAIVNFFILLPLYSTFMPMDALIQSFSAFIPFIKTRLDIVLDSTIPFNLVKGLLISIITFVIYKKLSPILKGAKS